MAPRTSLALIALACVACGDDRGGPPPSVGAPATTEASAPAEGAGDVRPGKLPPHLRGHGDYLMRDEVIGHIHKPDNKKSFRWPEYPGGRVTLITNDLGFREDEPTAARPRPGVVRVLMTGDSHLDGVLANDESFPNVLERALDAELPGSFEVINGGVGFYGPPHYARFLDRHADLEPHVFVVVVFCGNDFLDASRGVEFREGRLERPADYAPALERASRACAPAVAQGLNQVAYMKTFPDMRARTLDFVERQFDAIRARCDEGGILLRVVLWPSLVTAQPHLDAERLAAALDVLGLDADDVALERELGDGLLTRLTVAGVDVLDLRDLIAADAEPCYWVKDHHLSIRGHAVTAEAFRGAYVGMLRDLAAGLR